MSKVYKWLLSEKGQKIVDWLVPEIFSFILGISKDAFTGWRGRIKLKKLKYRLKKEIFEKILKKYGNEIFYNDLDSFLSQNNIIRKVIENCTDTSVSQYRSNSAIVTFYIKQFEERYPKYKRYHLEIVNMLQQCFAIIFDSPANSTPMRNHRSFLCLRKLQLSCENKVNSQEDKRILNRKFIELFTSYGYNGYIEIKFHMRGILCIHIIQELVSARWILTDC